MIKKSLLTFCIAILTISVIEPAIVGNAFAKAQPQGMVNARLIKQVRHELAMLPYYGVIDWLEVEGRPDNPVVLRGQGVGATPKSDAGARVRVTDGASKWINEIEVLPL